MTKRSYVVAIAAVAACALGVVISLVLIRLDDLWARGRVARSPSVDETSGAVSGEYKRIITLSPSQAEIVFALGEGHRVVGVGDSTSWPPEAKDKPKVGGYDNVNFERITELRPDLLIIQGEHDKVRDYARRRGIECLAVRARDIGLIYEAIRSIARKLDCVEQGEVLCARIALDLAQAAAETSGAQPPRVLLVIDRPTGSLSSIMTAGGKDFLSEVLELAGGRNIFADVDKDWPPVSKESIIERRPDVIIELAAGKTFTPDQLAARMRDWQSLTSVPAVASGRIYTMTGTDALIPGPRVGQLALRIAHLLAGREGGDARDE